MQIKINKSSLSEALNSVQAVVSSKCTLQILQNVKVEARDGEVKFTCSDLDTTLVANADCEVLLEGETTIPVKPFAAAVGKMVDGTIDIRVDDKDCATISAGSSVFKFNGITAKEFPVIPSPDGQSCTLESNLIREMLRKTSFAVSQDDTRRTLQGVLLEFKKDNGRVKAVGTDGRRLSMLDCSVDSSNCFDGQFILPKKAVDLLGKKLPKEGNAELVTAKGQLLVKTPHLMFTTKLLDETYPNYNQVIPPDEGYSIVINRAELIGALDRISVFTSGSDSPSVGLTFEGNNLTLNSGVTEYVSSHDEIPVKYDKEKIEMHFNPYYIRDVLSVMDDEEIMMRVVHAGKPVVIKNTDSNEFLYVVMPLRNH